LNKQDQIGKETDELIAPNGGQRMNSTINASPGEMGGENFGRRGRKMLQ